MKTTIIDPILSKVEKTDKQVLMEILKRANVHICLDNETTIETEVDMQDNAVFYFKEDGSLKTIKVYEN